MPALGMAQDSGVLVAWRKAAGDRVSAGDVLMEVETDKATMEVEAGFDGWVSELRAAEGASVPVGRTVAVIGDAPDDGARATSGSGGADADAAGTAGEDAPAALEGTPVLMPALGMAQDSGLIVSWAKAPGEKVAVGEVLLEVETDKSTMEIEAEVEGFVAEIRAAAGESVPVGETIALLAAERPAAPRGPGDRTGRERQPAAGGERPGPSPAPPAPSRADAASPPATGSGAETADATARASGTVPGPGGRVLASPKAKRLAAERGLALDRLVAGGVAQPFHVADVERFAASAPGPRAAAAPVADPAAAPARVEARVPTAPLADFLDWLSGETGPACGRPAVLAAFAAASLREANGADHALAVACEAARGDGRRVYVDPDGKRLSALAPADGETHAPAVVLRDLAGTRLTALATGAAEAPCLVMTADGETLDLALHFRPDALGERKAIAFLSAFAARLAEPLRHLL